MSAELVTDTRKLVTVEVILLPPEEKAVVPRSLRDEFKEFAIAMACHGHNQRNRQFIRAKLDRYQVHHVVPRSLGGQHYGNLALVEPVLHTLIHHQINGEIKGMAVGDTRLIVVPRYQGPVWGMNKPEGQYRFG